MPPTHYDLPNGSLEDRGYLLFDDDLEEDELIVFHATPAKNLDGILTDGLHPGAKFGGNLNTISYGETSKDAMVHRHYSDTKSNEVWAAQEAARHHRGDEDPRRVRDPLVSVAGCFALPRFAFPLLSLSGHSETHVLPRGTSAPDDGNLIFG